MSALATVATIGLDSLMASREAEVRDSQLRQRLAFDTAQAQALRQAELAAALTQAELDTATTRADAASGIADIERQSDIDSRGRQRSLNRALASLRARLAARGVAGGGSARALSRGLLEESDQIGRDARLRALSQVETIGRQRDERLARIRAQQADVTRRADLRLAGIQGRNLLTLSEENERARLAGLRGGLPSLGG